MKKDPEVRLEYPEYLPSWSSWTLALKIWRDSKIVEVKEVNPDDDFRFVSIPDSWSWTSKIIKL